MYNCKLIVYYCKFHCYKTYNYSSLLYYYHFLLAFNDSEFLFLENLMRFQLSGLFDFILQYRKGKFIIIAIFIQLLKALRVGTKGHK